jgi:hypothetical protein
MTEPIHVYFTGDSEGPNVFGVVYDDEDEARECARENDLEVWRVPVVPNLAAAERIPFEDEEDDDEGEEEHLTWTRQ